MAAERHRSATIAAGTQCGAARELNGRVKRGIAVGCATEAAIEMHVPWEAAGEATLFDWKRRHASIGMLPFGRWINGTKKPGNRIFSFHDSFIRDSKVFA